jgi:hypothetical protein
MSAVVGLMEKALESLENRGIYANSFRIGYGAAEFLLDFGRQFEGAEAEYYQRIITSPVYARELTQLLAKSLLEYEQKYGAIPEEWGT